MKQLLFVRRLS